MNKELLEYFNGDELAASVWEAKYAQDGENTPKDMHLRMAKEFFRVDKNYQDKEPMPDKWNDKWRNLSDYGKERKPLTEEGIFNFFDKFKYIVPQGSVMATLGTNKVSSLSNCFFNGIMSDTVNDIYNTAKEMAQVGKRRGGTATDLSNLRPKGAYVNNSASESSGAVSFLDLFDVTGKLIGQKGRKMAMMVTMSVNHPDILDFINVKKDLTKVTNANLSVKMSDEFMKAVENDEDFILRFPVDINIDTDVFFQNEDKTLTLQYSRILDKFPYDKLVSGINIKDNSTVYIKRIKAKGVWDELIKSNYKSAEPGMLYWDTILNRSPDAVYNDFRPQGVNPCSEIVLSKSDSCRLMSVNLYGFVNEPFSEKASFNFEKFYRSNYEALRLNDDLVDLEVEYVERIINKIQKDNSSDIDKQEEINSWREIQEIGRKGRRTGLGFTALGDTLAALNIKYGSEESDMFIESVMQTKMESELDCSIDLAILRGTFDGWEETKEYNFINEKGEKFAATDSFSGEEITSFFGNGFYLFLYQKFPFQAQRMMQYGRRNVSFSTIAPTGTVSILTGTTSGLEPLFRPFYTRRKKITKDSDRVDFVDKIGDKWQEYFVLHPKFKEWLLTRLDISVTEEEKLQMISNLKENTLLDWFKLSPWHGSTANDLKWQDRVRTQSILQKYITHSLSSTVNLPSDTTEQVMSGIYMEAWKQGLKGITTYRDTCRDGVLVDKKPTELVTFNETHAPKRPKKLDAKVFLFNNNYEKWVAFIGLLDGKPYELFTGLLSNVNLPSNVEYGEIVKVRLEEGKKRFDFEYEGGVVEGISRVTSKDIYNYGRMLSGLLRHGMGLPYVVNTMQNLEWEEEHINTWKNGVIRVLRKFIKEETTSLKCPECGADMKYTEGCMSCSANCGYSKCG